MVNKKQSITPPLEFNGEGQLILYTRYGDPRENGWENKWITEWGIQTRFPWFPAEKICIHKHFKPILEQAFSQLELTDLHTEIMKFKECYELRRIKGSKLVLSVHSWGAAIDLNAAINPVGSMGQWSKKFIEVMEANDVYCGQSWTGRKDPMHFSMVNS